MEAEAIQNRDSVLNLFINHGYGASLSSQWESRTLLFSDRAKMRLNHIAGFIHGLSLGGMGAGDPLQEGLARKLAADLNEKLHYLSQYGGVLEDGDAGTFPCGKQIPSVPRYKVVLHDDGTFGGFRVCWYSVGIGQSPPTNMEHPDLLCNQKIEGVYDWNLFTDHSWRSDGQEWHDTVRFDYRFRFNGGLLFHGLGNEPWAVRIGNDQSYWSIHT